MTTIAELKKQHPEWCFKCGCDYVGYNEACTPSCWGPASPVVAALIAKAEEDEARIAKLAASEARGREAVEEAHNLSCQLEMVHLSDGRCLSAGEVETLTADKAALEQVFGDLTRFMDPPDGGSPTFAELVSRWKESLEREAVDANARAEDMVDRNTKLRHQRHDYYTGSALQIAESERDTALAESQRLGEEVVALREWIETTAQHPAFCGANWSKVGSYEAYTCTCGKIEVLSNTSSTAEEVVKRIEREALEKATVRVGDAMAKVFGHQNYVNLLRRTRAAILGEKEGG